jgi:hypothetical protein
VFLMPPTTRGSNFKPHSRVGRVLNLRIYIVFDLRIYIVFGYYFKIIKIKIKKNIFLCFTNTKVLKKKLFHKQIYFI